MIFLYGSISSELLNLIQMQRSNIFIYILFLLFTISFSACNDDDLQMEEPVELITTLIYTLTPNGGGDTVVLSFRDTDGDGGNAPVISTEPLQAGTTYSGLITLLNESETPSEDIAEEVSEEAEEHQFFYSVQNVDVNIEYQDQDAEGNPLGIATELVSNTTGNGSITITLRHEPDKNADGVSNGLIANAGGETDIEVTFDVVVE
jgi:hypothetical protein